MSMKKAIGDEYFIGLLTGTLLMLALCIAAMTVIYFDIGGAKESAVEVLRIDEASRISLEEKSVELDVRVSELDKRQETLDKQEKKLEKLETKLLKKENELTDQQALMENVQLQVEEMAVIYEDMDPVILADVLADLTADSTDQSENIKILLMMNRESRSELFSNLDAITAAKLIAAMTKGG